MKPNNSSQSFGQTKPLEEIVMQPPLYFAQQHIWNVCFHPSTEILACSEITGQIEILKYDSDDVVPIFQTKEMHKSSARYCAFNPSGNLLASCGEDRRLGFMDGNGKIAHIIKKAHPAPIFRCKFLNDHILVSGDDEGLIKVWDLRTTVPVFQAEQQTQQITGFAFSPEVSEFQLYASCLNGTVAGYDLRQTSDSLSKLLMLSDSIDEQLSGIEMVKNGKYLICPSSQGSLIIFKRDELEHNSDRIQCHPGSVQSIVKIDQNTVVTGSEDGFLRGVSIYPNKMLQVLGQHEEDDNFPIQSISLSHCKRFMASSSHDNSINFYDVNQFVKKRMAVATGDGEQPYEESLEVNMDMEQSPNESKIWEAKNSKAEGDDHDDEEFESDDSDDSNSEQQQEMNEEKKKNKKSGTKKLSIKAREKQIKKENAKSFFKGL